VTGFVYQLDLKLATAARAVASSLSERGRRDATLVLKTVLTELLGGPVVRPWRLHRLHEGLAMVLGYGTEPVEDVQKRLCFALPELHAAVRGCFGHRMPALEAGHRLRFALHLVPTVKETGKGEIDAFLHEIRRAPDALHARAAVYTDYIAQRLNGAQVVADSVEMEGFRLQRMVRRAGDGWSERIFPVAEMRGTLTVSEPALLRQTLLAGIGRQRGFGAGFLRLETLK
jgi:hypothetical protein